MFATFKFAAAALALTAAGTALAAPAEQRATRDGRTFVYTSTVRDDGRTVIDGRHSNGERFHLVVRNGRVTGQSGGMPVSFRVAESAGATNVASVVTAN